MVGDTDPVISMWKLREFKAKQKISTLIYIYIRDYINEIISSIEKQTMEGGGNLENIFKWYISQRTDV